MDSSFPARYDTLYDIRGFTDEWLREELCRT